MTLTHFFNAFNIINRRFFTLIAFFYKIFIPVLLYLGVLSMSIYKFSIVPEFENVVPFTSANKLRVTINLCLFTKSISFETLYYQYSLNAG